MRGAIAHGARTPGAADDGKVLFFDLSGADSAAVFEGSGDYQFDVYRLMRTAVDNDWRRFHPRTNVLWLHYLVDKLLTAKRLLSPTAATVRRELRQLHKRTLSYASANDMLRDPFIAAMLEPVG